MSSTRSTEQRSDGRPRRGRPSDLPRQRRAAEVISHHLRTPLTVVRSGLALLDEPTAHLSAVERTEVMADVRQATEHLVSVVDDLLVILTPKSPPLRTEPVLLQRLLPAVLAEGLGGEVRLIDRHLDDELPPICGDPERIAHVIRNLVASAATVDRGGAVRVDARARSPWVDLAIRSASGTRPDLATSDGDAAALAVRSARRIASAMGGRLSLRRAGGYALTLRLPIAAEGC